VPPEQVLSIAGHLPRTRIRDGRPAEWPEFGEYARRKYLKELDEDEVTMIEGLIERRRERGYVRRGTKDSYLGISSKAKPLGSE